MTGEAYFVFGVLALVAIVLWGKQAATHALQETSNTELEQINPAERSKPRPRPAGKKKPNARRGRK